MLFIYEMTHLEYILKVLWQYDKLTIIGISKNEKKVKGGLTPDIVHHHVSSLTHRFVCVLGCQTFCLCYAPIIVMTVFSLTPVGLIITPLGL